MGWDSRRFELKDFPGGPPSATGNGNKVIGWARLDVQIIKSEQDCEKAMARLSVLTSRYQKPDSKEENELDLLA